MALELLKKKKMNTTKFIVLSAFLFCSPCLGRNVILILTDDLDSVLDGMAPLNKTRELIGDQGVTFKNAFAAVPICCPNRASILTGRYQHNHRTFNNSLEGGCNSEEWRLSRENATFAAFLNEQVSYKTFYAGKYLNQYGHKDAGGWKHVPPGWDSWYGLIGNSKYFNYSLSINGEEEKRYGASQKDYLTDVIKGYALDFLQRQEKEKPFLMMIAPPAPHEPFTPPARYNDQYMKIKAKRTESFNVASKDKHWLVRMGPSPLPSNVISKLDSIYRRRWETLSAVDEIVEDIYTLLEQKELLDETFIIFTSDNGFHIGQFSQPYDKRQPYETDIRVPLLIRGPGMVRGTEVKTAVSSVDLFATILDIAGLEKPSDGTSLLKYETAPSDRTVLVEYSGEKSRTPQNTGCPVDNDINLSHCKKDFACKCQDAANNTFTCARRVARDFNNVFCIFNDDEDFVEYYDLKEDKDQMKNLGFEMKSNLRYRFRKRLRKMSICKNASCMITNPPGNKQLPLHKN